MCFLRRLVLELGRLGYFVKYPSSPNSGTNLPIPKLTQIVPELGGLGYFTKYPATKYGTVLGGPKLLLLLFF